MDEKRIINLLALLIDQMLRVRDVNECSSSTATEMAEACWDGLIMLLRETLLQRSSLSLQGFGYFRRSRDTWSFRPAAAVAEIQALRLQPEEGNLLLARQSLSLLEGGLSTLEMIPLDVEDAFPEDRSAMTRAEKTLIAIFGSFAQGPATLLSSAIRSMAVDLNKNATRLANTGISRARVAEEGTATTARREPADVPNKEGEPEDLRETEPEL